MKTKVSIGKDSRWTRPGKMNKHELMAGVQQAEEGSFHSVQESMTNFEQWLKTRKKL